MSNAAYFIRTTYLATVANQILEVGANEELSSAMVDAISAGQAILVKVVGGVETIISQA